MSPENGRPSHIHGQATGAEAFSDQAQEEFESLALDRAEEAAFDETDQCVAPLRCRCATCRWEDHEGFEDLEEDD